MKNFDREELIEIRKRAKELANEKGVTSDWVWAYKQLANAANVLDAFIARTVIPCDPEEQVFEEPTNLCSKCKGEK